MADLFSTKSRRVYLIVIVSAVSIVFVLLVERGLLGFGPTFYGVRLSKDATALLLLLAA